jgi:hypothetical protein
MRFYRRSVLKELLRFLSCLLAVTAVCMSAAGAAVTIAKEGTSNPTLLYEGKPMFKFGPLPETAVFAMKWGSRDLRHRAWLGWIAANGFGYGRVYPESGYARMSGGKPGYAPLLLDADGRIFPFEVVRWERGKPVVDLSKFDREYWSNMARVIRECARRGIVLQMQLYQRVYFEYEQQEAHEGWVTNYFNPANNVNGFEVPEERTGDGLWSKLTGLLDGLIGGEGPREGYGLFQAMTQGTVWRDLHRQWVEHILDAIGDNGNVMIDLMNEAGFNKGMTRDWVEFTLDIIERWEKETDNDLRVGMDFDHAYKAFLKSGDAAELEYILAHPRLDLIIAEGAESHVVPTLVAGDREALHKDIAVEYRRRYRKPVISTNSPAYGAQDDLEALHLYQWYSLMTKVQGVGVYAKDYAIDFSKPPHPEYARRARILTRFFETLKDYAALQPAPEKAVTGPGEHRLALSSSKEAVVYVHTGRSGEEVGAGAHLALKATDMPEGAVAIKAVDPGSGRSRQWQGRVRDGMLAMELPGFEKDLAIHIVSASQGHERP